MSRKPPPVVFVRTVRNQHAAIISGVARQWCSYQYMICCRHTDCCTNPDSPTVVAQTIGTTDHANYLQHQHLKGHPELEDPATCAGATSTHREPADTVGR